MDTSLYETYHSNRKISRKVVSKYDFTYINLLKVVDTYIRGKNLEILDVGCGVGTLSLYLALQGHSVLGIDVSRKAVNTAIDSSKTVGLDARARFVCSDFTGYKFNKKFDAILISEVLEHMSNDRLVLKTLKKLLNRDSVLILSVPSKNAPLYKIGLLKSFDKTVGHLRRYTLTELLYMTNAEGFVSIAKIKAEGFLRNLLFTNRAAGFFVRFLKGPISVIFQFFDNTMVSIFGESQIILVCKLK